MPVQYPYERITAAGTYRIKNDTQLIMIALDSGTVNVYLPYPKSLATPMMIMRSGGGGIVNIYPTRSKTISGGSSYTLPFATIGEDHRLELMPSMGSDGNLDGNWVITGGKNVQLMYAAQASPQLITNDTITKITGLIEIADVAGAYDPTTSLWTPPERGNYEVTVVVDAAGMTAGSTVMALMRLESDSDETDSFRQTNQTNGDATQVLVYQFSVTLANDTYRLSLNHTDAAARLFRTIWIGRRLV